MDKNTMLDELVLRFDMDNYMDGEQSLWQHKTDVDALTPVYAKLNRRFPLPLMSICYSIIDGRAVIQMPFAFGPTHRVQTLSHFLRAIFETNIWFNFV
ncbi:MAG: hypothetical protein IPL73_06745 [Candidatus Obscuribacter sp.]|nr:hypothetical protein [Candidatus Obscuribacter sp.]